jgi:hypothetical protein
MFATTYCLGANETGTVQRQTGQPKRACTAALSTCIAQDENNNSCWSSQGDVCSGRPCPMLRVERSCQPFVSQ